MMKGEKTTNMRDGNDEVNPDVRIKSEITK